MCARLQRDLRNATQHLFYGYTHYIIPTGEVPKTTGDARDYNKLVGEGRPASRSY